MVTDVKTFTHKGCKIAAAKKFFYGPRASLAALSWDTSMENMSIRLNFFKVMLVLYLRNLEDTTLTKRVYLEPRFKGWPGLAEETVLICQYLQIEDCNLTKLDKEEYRKNYSKHVM